MLHSARGAHFEGQRISDVEQFPCDRQMEQILNNPVDGFEICGPEMVTVSLALPQKVEPTYTYSVTGSRSARIAGTA